MDTHIERKVTYVTFEVKSNIYAIPINETLGIIKLTHDVPQFILPGTKKCVKCIVEVDGLLIKIINMSRSDRDMSVAGDLIVVLEHTGQHIGISVDEVYLVIISVDKIVDDKVSGTKAFMYEGKACFILDDVQLYEYMGVLS